jgi:DNA-binding CsgD family transcriptional regulator
MQHEQMSQLTETIYDAALEPTAWAQVMAAFQEYFSTGAEAFYFLDFNGRSMRSVHVRGITDFYYRSFAEHYFTDDNPWIHAAPLHRPGIVRTDERLAEYFRDAQILRKSQYYNDWMKPQALDHTLGTTLLSAGGIMANLTLLRSADVGSFGANEVATFERLCGHLRRALHIAMRLETVTAQEHTTCEALDCLPYGAVFVDLQGKLLFCNRSAETLLQNRDGLTVHHGRLIAVDIRERPKLEAMLQHVAQDPARQGSLGPTHVPICRDNNACPLSVSAIRLSAHQRTFITAQPTILLLIMDPAMARPTDSDFMRQRYAFTHAEARLALALLTGYSLQRAADEVGMTYETARWYLKILFQKTATNRQSELVARLLRDMAVPLQPQAQDGARLRTAWPARPGG